MGLLSTFGAASGRAYGFTRSAIAAATDAFFNRVTLLLPGNGTNGAQNNTFLDSSSNTFSITRNGNTTQGTFSPFSQTGWSNYFNGTTDFLSAPNNAAFNLGSGDFTLEAFIFPNVSSEGFFLGYAEGLNTTRSFYFTVGTTFVKFYWYTNGSTANTLTATVSLNNSWNHVAVCRSGSTLYLFVNGVLSNSSAISGSLFSNANCVFNIGREAGFNGGYYTGYISNVRLVKGTALYTATFTPPALPLTNITNTSLLTCQSNRFVDNGTANSGTGFTITTGGTPSVQAFSPFAPTAAYSAATNGGSGYLDGTGDYLSNASNTIVPSTGDFTLQLWVYPTQVTVLQYLISTTSTNTGNKFHVYITASAYVGVQTGSSYRDSSTTKVVANAWNHVAITRTGSTYNIYVNGVLQTISGTGTMATTLDVTPTQIGSRDAGTSPITGYISGLRLTNVVETISVPTAPPTNSVSGGTVSLLLNFTNAGITDATSKNVLETVGNAQISTTQSKWGGSSMYFDGTGDYLDAPSLLNVQFGTGDFTIEGWLYINSLAATQVLFEFRATNGASYGQIYITTGGVLRFYLPTDIGTSNSFSTSTWTHFAITRSSGTLNMYINGTRGYSATQSGTMDASRFRIGADTAGSSGLNAYLDDLRITKGFARYTGSTLTVPTQAFALQ